MILFRISLSRHRPDFVTPLRRVIVSNFRFRRIASGVEPDEGHHHRILLFVANALPLTVVGRIVQRNGRNKGKFISTCYVVQRKLNNSIDILAAFSFLCPYDSLEVDLSQDHASWQTAIEKPEERLFRLA